MTPPTIQCGPGASSMFSLFQALEPCRILPDSVGTRYLEYSWTRNASMIFLDQPTDVGFAESDRVIGTLAEGAEDFEGLLEIFLDAFPALKGRELHIAGESVNVTSVILGNAFTDYASAVDGYEDILCSDDLDLGAGNEYRNKLCSKIKNRKSAKAKELCKAAEKFCIINITLPNTTSSGELFNLFDIRKSCPSPPICYPDASWIQTYLNSDLIKKALATPSSFNYAIYDPAIDSAFTENGDTALSTWPDIVTLLERGVSTLIYSGNLDSAVPSAGMRRALERLEWSGGNKWRKRAMRDWWYGEQTEKQKGGSVKGGDGLWWV
ncbi:Alpha/Beta hydrolase protein [Trichophaea hybrida]|nr:Alpha/Beta hydrolase protein [Trichophaea hybrida]